MTEQELAELRELPKTIQSKNPRQGFREEAGHWRSDLVLLGNSYPGSRFEVFLRQNVKYIENFSLGLIYLASESDRGALTLVRYNGAHGEETWTSDGHFAQPHIHYLTAEELAQGYLQPRVSRRVLTNSYATWEEAIPIFLRDIGVTNVDTYFEELLQRRLFNGD